jgi:hypothetical protein
LHKKLAATLTIAIFLISTLAIIAPVQAHFTLGDNTPGYPYHINDFDPHVPGVIGYVWPGGGENVYTGGALAAGMNPYTTVSSILPPGYVPPYPTYSLGLAGLPNTGMWAQNFAQLDGHEYSPFGAIVVNTSGDLIFAVNSTQRYGFGALYIAIPPEFKVPGVEQIVTTITNNYANILKYTVNPFDRYIPGWTLIRIIADGNSDIFPTGAEWYYVRINGVTAPSVAGKYFFKMYLTSPNYWVPPENWPVLLVKGELDPAIITGTIRFGGYNSTLYGTPMREAGMVWAKMKTKLDPYTNTALVDCTKLTGTALMNAGCADAKGYFNSTAWGHFEVEGVAPGVYDLYAEAAGFPLALIASNVQVLKGQSLHFDGYLNPGPVIHGDVFSKHSFGSEPWPANEYIKIELYSAPTKTHMPNATAGTPVSWSPLPCVAGGQNHYYPGNDADACGDPRTVTGGIAFPWFEWDLPSGAGGVYQSTDTPTGTDPQGVGPAQTWFVTMGDDIFHYEFGAKGMFGAPRDLDGHVPQIFATWVNGLTAGRYYVRAWVFRYVQSALDGATFQEYYFDVTPQEWAGDISLPLDLRISSWVNKTVHFHDNAGTLVTSPITTGALNLVGRLVNTLDSVIYSFNVTVLTVENWYSGHASVAFYGLNDTWLGQNYGIPAGTYMPKVAALGYLQQTQDLVSVTLSGTPIYISNHLYRGVGFNFTVYSIDWERPRVNRNWVWPLEDIGIGIFTEPGHNFLSEACYSCDGLRGLLYPSFQWFDTYWFEVAGKGTSIDLTLPAANFNHVFYGLDTNYRFVGGRMSSTGSAFTTGSAKSVFTTDKGGVLSGGLFASGTLWPTAFDSGMYSFQAWTYGYIQDKDFVEYANKGQIADIKINLIIGVNVTIDILFKKEHLISGTPNVMSGRVRLFDDSGRLVSEWMSSEGVYVTGTGRATGADENWGYPFDYGLNYIPGGVEILHINMAGFPAAWIGDGTLYGDPVFTAGSGDFELDNWPFEYWSVANAHYPNQGILGQPDYMGTGWTVEVDFVNLYLNGTAASQAILGPNTPLYYPIVPGLLMGESFHIIPGTAAKSKISLTEDGALDSTWGVGHSMAANHLGPYSQQGVWSITNAHLSGETSAVYEVDLNGYLSGTALAFTWSNELRTLSWYTVTVTGAANGSIPFKSYTNDGIYEFYLAPGSYSMTLAGPGWKTTSMGTIAVTDGQTGLPGAGVNIGLPPTNIPIPEFSGIAIVAFSALAASLYLLRRRRR